MKKLWQWLLWEWHVYKQDRAAEKLAKQWRKRHGR